MAWFEYFDMSSGGRQKTEWERIYVEADSAESADKRFEERTGRYPHNVTCDCCGEDFAVAKDETLEEASAYARKSRYGVLPLEEFIAIADVLIMPKEAQ